MLSIGFAPAVIAQEKKVVYTCPMHPDVQMDKPGNCPKCGMTLIKKTSTVAETHDHVQMNMGTDTTKPKMRMSDTASMKDMNMEAMKWQNSCCGGA